MKIIDNVIIEATKEELYDHFYDNDMHYGSFTFEQYMLLMKKEGVKIL